MQQHRIMATTPTTMETRMVVVRGPIRDASLFKAPHPSFLCSALRRIALGDSPQYFLKQ